MLRVWIRLLSGLSDLDQVQRTTALTGNGMFDLRRRKDFELLQGEEYGGGLGEEGGDGDAHPTRYPRGPRKQGVGDEGGGRWVELCKQRGHWGAHIDKHRADERSEVGAAGALGRDDVGDGAEADGRGQRRGGGREEGKPLLGEDDGGEEAAGGEAVRKAEQRVDVSAAGIGEEHHMASAETGGDGEGWWLHGVEVGQKRSSQCGYAVRARV